VLRPASAFDVILGGAGNPGEQEGLLAWYTAEALGVPFAGAAVRLSVHATENERELFLQGADDQQRVGSLPAMVAIGPEVPLRQFSTEGYLGGLSQTVILERWPRRVDMAGVTLVPAGQVEKAPAEKASQGGTPVEAASELLHVLGVRGEAAAVAAFADAIDSIVAPAFAGRIVAILGADANGQLEAGASAVLRAAQLIAGRDGGWDTTALVLVGPTEEAQRRAAGVVRHDFPGDVVLLVADPKSTAAVRGRLLHECWPTGAEQPRAVLGEPWAEESIVRLAFAAGRGADDGAGPDLLALRVSALTVEDERLVLTTVSGQGKLLARRLVAASSAPTEWLTLTADAEVSKGSAGEIPAANGVGRVYRWEPRLERFYGQHDIQRLLGAVKTELDIVRLADAEFIIDVGFGVGNRDGYEAVIDPLEKALRALGVTKLVIGGSRKVTEELHLLPADRQIGQSGVSVNPRVLLAIGISGAPQHLNYIGPRATILAFNRDPDAPLMTLNRRQPQPRVFRIVGDLFETVPAFIAALRQEPTASTPTPAETVKT
jgi:electron transfer flavoprotein alpha subunit